MDSSREARAMEYRIKDRSAKVAKRRNRMPVNGRSVFVIQAVIGKKAAAAKAGPK